MRQILVSSVLALGTALAGTAAAEPYPANVRDSFMSECQAKATAEHCTCILGQLEASVPVASMLDGTVTDEQINGFVDQCLASTAVTKGDWPPSLDTAFIDGCKAELDEDLCRCLHGKVEKELDFTAVVSNQADAAQVQGLLDACVAELGAAPAAPAPAGEPPTAPSEQPPTQ